MLPDCQALANDRVPVVGVFVLEGPAHVHYGVCADANCLVFNGAEALVYVHIFVMNKEPCLAVMALALSCEILYGIVVAYRVFDAALLNEKKLCKRRRLSVLYTRQQD